MAFTFPEDKKDFTAANGVTYSWNGEKWVTKTFKADESVLEDYVKEDQFTSDQAAQDQLIAENRRSIEELEVTKGPVSRYDLQGHQLSSWRPVTASFIRQRCHRSQCHHH